jgi:hypothetical protein
MYSEHRPALSTLFFVLFYEPVPEDFYLPLMEGEIGLPGISAIVVGVRVP